MDKKFSKLFFLILPLTFLSFILNQFLVVSAIAGPSYECGKIIKGPSPYYGSIRINREKQENWDIQQSYQDFPNIYEKISSIDLKTFFTKEQWENLLVSFRLEKHLISLIVPSPLLTPSERRQKITFSDQRELRSQSSIIQLNYAVSKLKTNLTNLFYVQSPYLFYPLLDLIEKYPAYLLAFRKFTNFIYKVVLEERIPYNIAEYERFTRGALKINEIPVLEKRDALLLFLAFAKLLRNTYSNLLNETILVEKDIVATLTIFDLLHRLSQTGRGFNTEGLLALKRILLKHTIPQAKNDATSSSDLTTDSFSLPIPTPNSTNEIIESFNSERRRHLQNIIEGNFRLNHS